MPRGAIQPTNTRSPRVRSVRRADSAAATGRTATTSTATSASVGSSRPRTETGVTVAEIEMKSTPMISWTRASKNGCRDGISNASTFATTRPITMAAIRPVSSRTSVAHPGDREHRGELYRRAERGADPHPDEQKPQHPDTDEAAEERRCRRC